MIYKHFPVYLTTLMLAMISCAGPSSDQPPVKEQETILDTLRQEGEDHLRNIRQLTFGGENAEAYFSSDNSRLVFQRTDPSDGVPCDQIYTMDLRDPEPMQNRKLISTGKGRTTCAYFLPGDSTIIYASTHLSSDSCLPVPDRKKIKKYVWPIYDSYELFVADLNGNIVRQLTDNDYYDAEATVSPANDLVVFTSMQTGDLELYTMKTDGSDIRQVTDELGYDGGAFFSPDGQKLVFRASRPSTEEEIREYKELLARGLVAPTNMEVYTCNIDGSGMTKVTDLGKANWAPFFHPSGEKILFSSNHGSTRGFPFNLYLINVDGSGLKKVTNDKTFDAFPMFSPDGKYLVFASNRNNKGTRDTNLFIAEWVD